MLLLGLMKVAESNPSTVTQKGITVGKVGRSKLYSNLPNFIHSHLESVLAGFWFWEDFGVGGVGMGFFWLAFTG